MRIAVIGAGWFGCHIALELRDQGHSITVFEAQDDLFRGASGLNQNRLHLGFHYPRSFSTRCQSRDGYQLFVDKYPSITAPIADNIYAVASQRSYIDFETFTQVMRSSRLSFQIRNPFSFGLKAVTGSITCSERLILMSDARETFRERLGNDLLLSTPVTGLENGDGCAIVNGETFDAVINCTWSTFRPPPNVPLFYEACVLLLYRGDPGHPAITIMDGPFFSLYPMDKDLFTLSSVQHTPLGRFADYPSAKAYLQTISAETVEKEWRPKFEASALEYFPPLLARFSYAGYFTAIKTKIDDSSDVRNSVTFRNGRIITVLSGKIDSVFTATTDVMTCLKAYC